jgi:cell division protein FtsB
MTTTQQRPRMGGMFYLAVAASVGLYFIFAAVQGDYGVFRQVQLNGEAEALRSELVTLTNLTRRLSDDFLDIELLDEQVRDTLGYIRADEIVFR